MNRRIKKKYRGCNTWGPFNNTPRKCRLVRSWIISKYNRKTKKKHKFHTWFIVNKTYPQWTNSKQLAEVTLMCMNCGKKKVIYVERGDAKLLYLGDKFKMKCDDYMREYEIQGFREYALLSKKGLEE